jgi:hypothetical protein
MREDNLLCGRKRKFVVPLLSAPKYTLRAMWDLVEESLRDFRYAWHLMRKSPGFAAVAVLALVVGIGGNTTMFSAVRAVLLRPLAYRDPATLLFVTVFFSGPPGSHQLHACPA